MKRSTRLLLLLLCCTLFFGSRFFPSIERIEVTGGEHYSANELVALANLELGAPLLWVTKSSLRALEDDPWIAHAQVYKRFPGTVHLFVNERKAYAFDGVQTYAIDGTVLTGASTEELSTTIKIKGWGEPRYEEAFELLGILESYAPKVISFSPAGFTIQLASSSVFTPSADALKTHWASFLSQQGAYAYVYPWGVSARE